MVETAGNNKVAGLEKRVAALEKNQDRMLEMLESFGPVLKEVNSNLFVLVADMENRS